MKPLNQVIIILGLIALIVTGMVMLVQIENDIFDKQRMDYQTLKEQTEINAEQTEQIKGLVNTLNKLVLPEGEYETVD